MYQLGIQSEFCAAHRLGSLSGGCDRLHGHNYEVELRVQGAELNAGGCVVDFIQVEKQLKEILMVWDHQFLNDLPDFQEVPPTAEWIARLIFEKMEKICEAENFKVHSVLVRENRTYWAKYER